MIRLMMPSGRSVLASLAMVRRASSTSRSGFEQRLVETADAGRLLPSTFRREPKRSGQTRDRMRRTVERRKIGDHRIAPRLQLGRARLTHRGASRGDGETSGVITLCGFPSRVASVTGAPARREGERLGIGTVDNKRRDRIDPVGTEDRILLRFRLVGVMLVDGIA